MTSPPSRAARPPSPTGRRRPSPAATKRSRTPVVAAAALGPEKSRSMAIPRRHREQHAAREAVERRARRDGDRDQGRPATTSTASRGPTFGRSSLARIDAANGEPQVRAGVSRPSGCGPPQTWHGQPGLRGRASRRATAPGSGGSREAGGSARGSQRRVKHWPHHSASGHASALQDGQRRSVTGHAASVPRDRRRSDEPERSVDRLAEPRRRAARRSAPTCAPPPPRHARPCPSGRARCGVAEDPSDGIAHLGDVGPVDQEARLAVHERLARAARVPDDDRSSACRRLQEHDAPPLDLEPAEPVAARHREDVADRVVARQLRRRAPRPRRTPTGAARSAPGGGAAPPPVPRPRSSKAASGTWRLIRRIALIRTS